MMKYIFILMCMSVVIGSSAQRVLYPSMDLSNRSGHVYALDRMPDRSIRIGGDNEEWDFTGLYSPAQYQYKVEPISGDGMMLRVKSAWGTELILDQEKGKHRITREIHKLSRHHMWEKTYQRPMRYVEPAELVTGTKKKEYLAEWSSYLSRSELKSLGVLKYNNLYFEVEERDVWVPDGKGLLYLADDIIDVKRWIKRTYRSIKLYTKEKGKESVVSNSILRDMLSLDLNSFSEELLYVDTRQQRTAAVVALDDYGRVDRILYQASAGVAHSVYNANKNNVFTLYPSTSYGDLRFDFANFDPGRYTLIVYNIMGKQMWAQDYDISDDNTIREDFSFLPKGTYQYTLKDENRNRLLTRRFVIIKP